MRTARVEGLVSLFEDPVFRAIGRGELRLNRASKQAPRGGIQLHDLALFYAND